MFVVGDQWQLTATTGILAAMTPSQIAFYATVATVIPVLFLAIAVQGRVILGLFKTGVRLITTESQIRRLDDVMGTSDNRPQPRSATGWAILCLVVLLQFIAIAIVAAGGYGKLLSVYALYQGHDQTTTRQTVLVATMFLIILLIITVVAGPLRIAIAWFLRGKPLVSDSATGSDQETRNG
jgi:hypothetical protein